jgi:hypothetical protein
MSSDSFQIDLDPPGRQTQHINRKELRECLRLAKKFGNCLDSDFSHLYTSGDKFYIEVGITRRGFLATGDWSGCASIPAIQLLQFWNSLPKDKTIEVSYQDRWLGFGTLRIGRAVWQPKYDPEWLEELKHQFSDMVWTPRPD